ncbi:MAG TPA: GNAT family N-acetyltransferase [Patescibacteria group bacterium]|nr:GNAT family N-acetyltransferase [Patescibacteria group bacterium]
MPRTVVLRPYEDRDLPGTLELRPRVYPGWKDAGDAAWHIAVYEWLGRNPVEAPMHRWVLDDGGAIVGHLAAVPLAYRIGGARVIAYTPTDYMALPGYGFHAVALMRTFFQATESYVACNVAGEVSKIEGLFGPRRVAGLHQAVKVLDLGRYPRLPSPLLRPLAGVASLGLRAVDAIRVRPPNGALDVREEDTATAFDPAFDRFFESAAATIPCMPEKTAAFLRWRYGPGTPRPVRLLTARDAGGSLHGYAMIRTTASADGFILDLMGEPGRRDVGRALLAEAIRRFWRDRAFVVRYRFLPSTASPSTADLARFGFRFPGATRGVLPGARPERQLELSIKLADPASQAAAAAPEHWSYNLGDGEASFWVP